MPYKQEVAGSSPVSPNIFNDLRRRFRRRFLLWRVRDVNSVDRNFFEFVNERKVPRSCKDTQVPEYFFDRVDIYDVCIKVVPDIIAGGDKV